MSDEIRQTPPGNGFHRQPPTVPGHRLLRRIGAGGFGEVWLAEDTTLHELRAIKFVWRDVLEGARVFEREMEGVKRFEPISREHPGLVDILGVGQPPDGQSFWTVMELADNAAAPATDEAAAAKGADLAVDAAHYSPRTLLGEVRRRGRLPVPTALEYSIQLADAVASLHAADPRRLHRDIKPGNVVFIHDQPKLGDPGLVIFEGEARTQYGTPGFMPPEGPGRPEADVYSLGKTLYFMATGLPVERFPELPTAEIPGAELTTWNRLNDVICRACAKDPDQRYRNAGELLDDLQRIRGGRKPRRCKRPDRAIVPAVLASLAIVGVVMAVLVRRPHERTTLMQDVQFNPSVLGTHLWQTGRSVINEEPTNWFRERGTSNIWSRTEPYLTNGALILETEVHSSTNGGRHINQDVWVDWAVEWRNSPEKQIEIDLEAEAPNGTLCLAIVSHPNATNRNESPQQTLLSRSGHALQALTLKRSTVVIDLSPATGYAVVSSSGARYAEPDVIDLRPIPQWYLRIGVAAHAAAGMHLGRCKATVHGVRVSEVIRRSHLVGFITCANSGLPFVGMSVRNRETGAECRTGPSGAYVLQARPGLNELEVLAPDCSIVVGRRSESTPSEGLYRHDLVVRRDPAALGDGLNKVSLPFVADGYFCASLSGAILTVPGKKLEMLEICEIPWENDRTNVIGRIEGVNGLALVNGRVWAVDTWHRSFLFELQADGSFRQGPELPTRFAAGFVYDGRDFWIAQCDRAHGAGFALFRWNPDLGLTNRIRTDLPITSPAWLNGKLWLLAGHVAYEVNPQVALSTGSIEPAILRRFDTPCIAIASDGTGLWGRSSNSRTLHRLYLP